MSDSADDGQEKTPVEQAVEHAFDLFVYAPIGLIFEGASLLPELVAKGKAQVGMARMMGKFAVDEAQKQATRAASKLQDQTAGVLDFVGGSVTPVAPDPTPAAAPPRPARTTPPASGPGADTLAIPDYDGLSASQVVNRLAGLSPVELTNVQQYEAAHRSRKTILSKVAQLQGALMSAAPDEACRPATAPDVPRLAELVDAAIQELRQGRGGEVWARQTARRAPYDPALHEQITDPHHHVLAGTVDGTVMGYAVARLEVLPDGGLLGVVTDLYTDPGCRELGIGEVMMDALVAWCREEGCFGVDSLALPGDRHTKNFFESFGLVARAIVVHRSLS